MAANDAVLSFENALNNTTVLTIVYITMYCSIIISYIILGLFADTFISRYRLIQFSLWIKLITVTMSTLMTALLQEYHLQDWLLGLLYSFLCIIEMLGHASFHVVAIQFGIDQLQGAPSQFLSVFIFWYFMAELIPDVILRWVHYLISLIGIKPMNIQLGMSLLVAVLFSVVLSIKNCFMSKWFVRESVTSSVTSHTSRNHAYYSNNSNPYRLIYCVLKFAKQHRSPIQRSALTYWEDETPSRIDLGKRKYGGPFTTEDVENVKTFLQLLKLLFSLSGILVASGLSSATDHNVSESDGNLMELIGNIRYTATIGLLILCHAISKCCFYKCYLSMLKQIGFGAALTIAYVVGILLINSIKYTTSVSVHIASYANLILLSILDTISYFVLSVSLIEFIRLLNHHTL